MPDRLLTLRAVCRLIAVRADEVWAWVEAGQFPAPVVLPSGGTRWSAVAVAAWQADLARARRRGRGRQVALDDLPPLGRDIWQALREAGGDWVGGVDLAARVGNEGGHTSGGFRKALSHLRDAGLIEADRRFGYRAVMPDDDPESNEGGPG